LRLETTPTNFRMHIGPEIEMDNDSFSRCESET
jgi:hypothetical protein